ncbi:hypothetical protein SRHO_G00038550 [Serrasalmus rhombeus]
MHLYVIQAGDKAGCVQPHLEEEFQVTPRRHGQAVQPRPWWNYLPSPLTQERSQTDAEASGKVVFLLDHQESLLLSQLQEGECLHYLSKQ